MLEFCYTGDYSDQDYNDEPPEALVALYILADYVMIDTLKNVVVSEVRTYFEDLRGPEGKDSAWSKSIWKDIDVVLRIVYGNTVRGDPLRKVYVEVYKDFIVDGWCRDQVEGFVEENGEFAKELFQVMEEHRTASSQITRRNIREDTQKLMFHV